MRISLQPGSYVHSCRSAIRECNKGFAAERDLTSDLHRLRAGLLVSLTL